MNTAVMNIEGWFSSFVAWLRKPARRKASASNPVKERVRIAGLR